MAGKITSLLAPSRIALHVHSTKRTAALNEVAHLLDGHPDVVNFAGFYEELLARDYVLIDCQMTTPHLLSLGARTVPRADYLARLAAACAWPDQPEAWG